MNTQSESKEDILKRYSEELRPIIKMLLDAGAKEVRGTGGEVILNPSPKLIEAMRKAKQKKQEESRQKKQEE